MVVLLSSCTRHLKKNETIPQNAAGMDDLEIIAENYVSDGVDFYQNKDYSAAVSRWKKAVKLIPNDAEVYNFIGLAYHKNSQLDSAIAAFKKAVELQPDYHQAWSNLGYMHFLKGEYNRALEFYNEALKVKPDYTQAMLNKREVEKILSGKVHLQAYTLVSNAEKVDSLELQIKNYRKALALDSAYVEAWNNLGVAYYFYGKTDSAVYCIKKALDLNPNYETAHNNAGYLLLGMGNPEKAVPHFQKAILIRPHYLEAELNLLDAYVQLKDYNNANIILQLLKAEYAYHPLVKARVKEYGKLIRTEMEK
ncbi:MAG: hypothetical protein Kow0037_15440 [Calditrichia bacterium]